MRLELVLCTFSQFLWKIQSNTTQNPCPPWWKQMKKKTSHSMPLRPSPRCTPKPDKYQLERHQVIFSIHTGNLLSQISYIFFKSSSLSHCHAEQKWQLVRRWLHFTFFAGLLPCSCNISAHFLVWVSILSRLFYFLVFLLLR